MAGSRPRCSASHGPVTLAGSRATSSRRARGDDAPAVRAAARAHVDEVVGRGQQVQVVVDDDDGRAGVQQPVEHADQRGHVERVQPGGRLVEDVQRAALAAAQPGGDPQPLRLAAGQRRRRLAQPQVTEADLVDGPQRPRRSVPGRRSAPGRRARSGQHVGDGQAVDPDVQRGVVEAGAVAGRALDGDVRQVLDVEVDVAEPPAGRALALAGVEGEVAGLPAPAPRIRGCPRTAGGSGRTPRSRWPGSTARSGRSARRRSGRPGGCRRRSSRRTCAGLQLRRPAAPARPGSGCPGPGRSSRRRTARPPRSAGAPGTRR